MAMEKSSWLTRARPIARWIAQSFGAKVFVEAWKGFAAQKNSAMDKASMDLVLQLDADERLEPGLASEMEIALIGSVTIGGFWIPRKNLFPRPLDPAWWFLSRSKIASRTPR